MNKQPTIEMICDKCGKFQIKDDKQSNKNWEIYPNLDKHKK